MSQNGGKELPPVVTYDQYGAARYDVGAAAKVYDATEREAALLMEDMRRQGFVLPGSVAPTGVPPRAHVRVPTMPDMGVDQVRAGQVGMSDIHNQQSDPGQRYWETNDMPRAPKGKRAVARKRTSLHRPPGMTEDQARFYEQYLPSLADRFLRDMKQVMTCGTYFVQQQPNIKPIPSARPLDIFTDGAGVAVLAGAARAVTVIEVNFPDRKLGVIDRFGFIAQDHTHYPSLTISMQRNDAPLANYGNFNLQIGDVLRPTPLAAPLLFGSNSRFRVLVTTTVNTIIRMRAQGWWWATKSESQDGSFKVFHND